VINLAAERARREETRRGEQRPEPKIEPQVIELTAAQAQAPGPNFDRTAVQLRSREGSAQARQAGPQATTQAGRKRSAARYRPGQTIVVARA